MKALTSYTILFLLISMPRVWSQTYTESMETLRFEIESIREQIILVIQDADKNLRESDKDLEAQKARVRALEKQNTTLKQRPITSGKGNKATHSRYEKEIAKLKEENKDLWQELEKGRIGTSRQTRDLLVKNQELEEDLQQAEKDKEKLRDQVESIREYAGKHQEAIQGSMMETYEENQRLQTEIESLKEQLSANTSYVGTNIAEREKMQAENARYKAKYDSLLYARRQASSITKVSSRGPSPETLVIDSLEYVNTELQNLISELSQTGTVDQARIHEIDLREKEIKLSHSRMAIREQMLRAREKDLEFKVQELTVKEAKYNNLEQKEKELKLLEQQLRDLLDGD